jgi:hypothetical protein
LQILEEAYTPDFGGFSEKDKLMVVGSFNKKKNKK